jgi:hypothetical protein
MTVVVMCFMSAVPIMIVVMPTAEELGHLISWEIAGRRAVHA